MVNVTNCFSCALCFNSIRILINKIRVPLQYFFQILESSRFYLKVHVSLSSINISYEECFIICLNGKIIKIK